MRQIVKISYTTVVCEVSSVHSNTTDTMLYVQQGIPVYLNSNNEWVKGMPGLNCICHAYYGLWSRFCSIEHSHLEAEGNCSQPMRTGGKNKATP